MSDLLITEELLDADKLDAWVARRRGAVNMPEQSAEFARLLKRKVRSRTVHTRRFFGEYFVASTRPHRDAFYSSVKWLTNPRFAGSDKLSDPDHERLRHALHEAFDRRRIEALQEAAGSMFSAHFKLLDGKRPTAPDLWLIDRRGRHHFIEVKLPGDALAPHQLAGLALIHKVLGRSRDVSVEIVHLNNDRARFKALRRLVDAG